MKDILLKDVSPTDLPVTLEKMATIVDPLCGIIKSVMPNWLEQGDARIFVFGAVGCEASPITVGPRPVHAGGAAINREQAIAATIGEAIERYCAAYSEPEERVFGSYSELAGDAVPPDNFCLYSERQYNSPNFPFKPLTKNAKVTWTWGESLQQNRAVLVPASLTHLPVYLENWEEGDNLGGTTSTGLACGNTIEEAILSGIGEVIERDALTCFWMNKLPARRILIDEDSSIFETFTEKLAVPGLNYYTCEITTDLAVPTFFTLLTGGSTAGFMINAGCQANLSPTRATLKSLVEAAHGRPYVRFIINNQPAWTYKRDFSSVNTFQDHAAFYTRAPQHQEALNFIKTAKPEKNLSQVPDLSTGSILGDIKLLLKLLAKHDLDVIVKDLTTPDIEDIGLKVVRVLIPGLQLLHGDHRFPFLGCPRLFRMKQTLGYDDQIITEKDLNPFPHPLP
jgi:ribosomal protein S12 methylthiotransferase accessory factor